MRLTRRSVTDTSILLIAYAIAVLFLGIYVVNNNYLVSFSENNKIQYVAPRTKPGFDALADETKIIWRLDWAGLDK